MLSKQTQDQIRKEAEDRSSNPAHQQGYEWGAEKYATKCEIYEKALKMIEQMSEPFNMKVIATKALEQFK